jgi:NAD(P)-dependent dehydrogenase (short-subunit alcohol dehydrogenase family)
MKSQLLSIIFFMVLSFGIFAQESKKVVLVTGSASGIGKATCEMLLDEGFTVYGGDIDTEGNQYLKSIGGTPLYMDITNVELVKKAVEKIIEEQGQIDVLFANAGYGLFGITENVALEDIEKQFDVNVFGTAITVNAVLPYMREKQSGKIIITSSIGGHVSAPVQGWYTSSKHAVEGYADALRIEVRQFGINVSIVEPGFTKTNFMNVANPSVEKAKKADLESEGVYQKTYEAFAEKFSKTWESGADADVIAKTVLKIVESKYPERRYRPNFDAKYGYASKYLFGDGLVDDILIMMFLDKQKNPLKRQSLTVSGDIIAPFNEGYGAGLSYNHGRLRVGINTFNTSITNNDDVDQNRQSIGLYLASFISDEQRGLNLGLGFDYYTKMEYINLTEGIAFEESLEKDLMKLSLRTSFLWDLIKLKNSSIFAEPGIKFGYVLGDEEMSFSDGKSVDKEEWDLTGFINFGIKFSF